MQQNVQNPYKNPYKKGPPAEVVSPREREAHLQQVLQEVEQEMTRLVDLLISKRRH